MTYAGTGWCDKCGQITDKEEIEDRIECMFCGKVEQMKFTEKQLDNASYNFFRCKFKDLDKSNQRWIIEGLQRLKGDMITEGE